MAFSLSNRMGMKGGRFRDDSGSGFRANTADFGSSAAPADRGSFGAEQSPSTSGGSPVMSSSLPGNPHSSSGFRRALERTQRKGNQVISGINKKDFSMSGGNRKPNYFAQGGRRRGLHIGAGAPVTVPAQQEGADAGGF